MMEKPNQERILVVDDTKENIETLFALLKDEYIIVGAKNGESAIKKAQKTDPDLILMDIMMPEMDGYEVCRRLKADEKTAGIPVIFITALSEARDEVEGFEAGAVDYIAKPFAPVIVKARIRTHLALKKYQTRLEDTVRQRTRQLEEAKIAAQTANRAKSDFLMTMSHELRTPLNGIMAASSMVLDCDARDERVKINDLIQSSGDSLLKTIQNILDFTNAKDGELVLEHLPFKLDALLEQLPTHFLHKGRYINLSLALALPSGDIPNALIGDQTRLADLLVRLLENAAKFTTAAARARLSLTVLALSTEKAELKFSLKDAGIGIASENLDKIFEPFYQADTSITRPYEGVGMGLSTCRQIIEQMGGKIWAESEPGKGSVFHFTAKFDRQAIEIPFNARIVHDAHARTDQKDASAQPMDPKAVAPFFKALEYALDLSNPQEIKVNLAKIATCRVPQIEQLVCAIDDYEYDEAIRLLKEIALEIGVPME